MELTVSELNDNIKHILNSNFSDTINIKGEISNLKVSNGHAYLCLKDSNSLINAIIWRSTFNKFTNLKNGDQIIAKSKLDVYNKNGKYQIYISDINIQGQGKLYKTYLELKKQLELNGYFSETHKKELPKLIQNIGIITSKTGAALQDILSVFKRNDFKSNIFINDSRVQGNDCETTLINGIKNLNKYELDVILITRGGGSLEDLWGFNEENVIKEIYKSNIPIITGVGHEVDFMLCDFVSDLRCATPSVAAEYIVNINNNYKNLINSYFELFTSDIFTSVNLYKEQLLNINLLNPKEKILNYKNIINQYKSLFQQLINDDVKYYKNYLQNINEIIETNNPNNILLRGYSIVSKNNEIITDSKKVKENDILKIKLYSGEICVKIIKLN